MVTMARIIDITRICPEENSVVVVIHFQSFITVVFSRVLKGLNYAGSKLEDVWLAIMTSE